MNKRENVQALLNQGRCAYTPSGFWLHFPKSVIESGLESQVKAHVDFAKACDLDIVKIMNENEFRRQEPIVSADDWGKIKTLTAKDEHFTRQKEILSRTLDQFNQKYYTLATVHGLVASLSHSSGHSYTESPELMMAHAKENPSAFREAVQATAENIYRMLELSETSEVDGIYYAALGGEKNRLTSEFFSQFIEPYELELLQTIHRKKFFLHMCKSQVDLQRFKDYPADVVNWAVHESDHQLNEAKNLFPQAVVMGGFDDRSGELVDGSKEDMLGKLNTIEEEMTGSPFILGADCTLPTEIAYDRIRFVVQEMRNRSRRGGQNDE